MSSSGRLFRPAEAVREPPQQQQQNCVSAILVGHLGRTKGQWNSRQLQHLAGFRQPLCVERVGEEMLLVQPQLHSCRRVEGTHHPQMDAETVQVQFQQNGETAAVLLQQQPQAEASALLCSDTGEDSASSRFTSCPSSSSCYSGGAAGSAAAGGRSYLTGNPGTAKALPSNPTPLCSTDYKQSTAAASSNGSGSRSFSISSSRSFSSRCSVSSSTITQQQPKSSSSSHGARCVSGSRQTTVATPRMQTACTSHSITEDEEVSRPFASAVCAAVPATTVPALAIISSAPASGASVSFFPASSAAARHRLATFGDVSAARCPPETAAALGAAVSLHSNGHSSPATLAAATAGVPAAGDTVGGGAAVSDAAAFFAAAKRNLLQNAAHATLPRQQHPQQLYMDPTAPAGSVSVSVAPLIRPQQQLMHLNESDTMLRRCQESLQRRVAVRQQQEQNRQQVMGPKRLVNVSVQQSHADPWLQQLPTWKQLQQQPEAAAALLGKQQHQTAGFCLPQEKQQPPRTTTNQLTLPPQSQRGTPAALLAQQQQRRLRRWQQDSQPLAKEAPERMQQQGGAEAWRQQQQSGSPWKQPEEPEATGLQLQQHYQKDKRLWLLHQQDIGPWKHHQFKGEDERCENRRIRDLPAADSVWKRSLQASAALLVAAATAGAAVAGVPANAEAATAEQATRLFLPSAPLGADAGTAAVWTETALRPRVASPGKLVVRHRTADLTDSLESSSLSYSDSGIHCLTAKDKGFPAWYPSAASPAMAYTTAAALKARLVTSNCPPPAEKDTREAPEIMQPTAALEDAETTAATVPAASTARSTTLLGNAAAPLCSIVPSGTSPASLLRDTRLLKAAGCPSTYHRLLLRSNTAEGAAGATATGALAGVAANTSGIIAAVGMETASEAEAEKGAATLTAADGEVCRGPRVIAESCRSTAFQVTCRGEAADSSAVDKSCDNNGSDSASETAAKQTQTQAAAQSDDSAEPSEAGTGAVAPVGFALKREAAGARQTRTATLATLAPATAAAQGAAAVAEDLAVAVTYAKAWEPSGGCTESCVAGPVAARATPFSFPEREECAVASAVQETELEPKRRGARKRQGSKRSSVAAVPYINSSSAENAPARAAGTAPVAAPAAGVAVITGARAPAAASLRCASALQGKAAEGEVPVASGSCFLASPQTLQQVQKQVTQSKQQEGQQPTKKEMPTKQQQQASLEQRQSVNAVQNAQQASSDFSPLQPSLVAGDSSRGGLGHYVFGDTLGEGTFGKVRLGVHAATQEAVAVKILDKQKIQEANDVERVMREIHILKTLRHPHIVQLLEIIETEHHLYLVMEYASGGELYDYIVERQHVDERQACSFFRQILAGVEEMHKLQICHRDLKPENILLDESKNIKIVDFGLSNTYSLSDSLLTTACGSPSYAAPEMIEGKAYQPLMVDLWSCGVILFTLLAGYLPFESATTEGLYKKIIKGTFDCPPWVSSAARHLLQGLLNTNPALRYNTHKIKQHPWYNMPHVRVGLPLLPLPYAGLAAAAAVVAAAHAVPAAAPATPADRSCINNRRRNSTSGHSSSSSRNSCKRGEPLPFSTCGLPACGSCVQWALCSPQRPLECVLRQMAEMGVDAEATKRHLAAGEINSLTAAYFLLVNRRHRRANSKVRSNSLQPRPPPALLLPLSPLPYYSSTGGPPPTPSSAAASAAAGALPLSFSSAAAAAGGGFLSASAAAGFPPPFGFSSFAAAGALSPAPSIAAAAAGAHLPCALSAAGSLGLSPVRSVALATSSSSAACAAPAVASSRCASSVAGAASPVLSLSSDAAAAAQRPAQYFAVAPTLPNAAVACAVALGSAPSAVPTCAPFPPCPSSVASCANAASAAAAGGSADPAVAVAFTSPFKTPLPLSAPAAVFRASHFHPVADAYSAALAAAAAASKPAAAAKPSTAAEQPAAAAVRTGETGIAVAGTAATAAGTTAAAAGTAAAAAGTAAAAAGTAAAAARTAAAAAGTAAATGVAAEATAAGTAAAAAVAAEATVAGTAAAAAGTAAAAAVAAGATAAGTAAAATVAAEATAAVAAEAAAAGAEAAAAVLTSESALAQKAQTRGGGDAHTIAAMAAEALAKKCVTAFPSDTQPAPSASSAETVTAERYLLVNVATAVRAAARPGTAAAYVPDAGARAVSLPGEATFLLETRSAAHLVNATAVAADVAQGAAGVTGPALDESGDQAASECVKSTRLPQCYPAVAAKESIKNSSGYCSGSSDSSSSRDNNSSRDNSSSTCSNQGSRSTRRTKAPGKDLKQQTKYTDNMNSSRSRCSSCSSNAVASVTGSTASGGAGTCSSPQTAGAATGGKTRGPPRSAHLTAAARTCGIVAASSSSCSCSRAARGGGDAAGSAATVLAPMAKGAATAAARRGSSSAAASAGGEDATATSTAVASKRNGSNKRKTSQLGKATKLPLQQLRQQLQQTTSAGFYTYRQSSAATGGRRRDSCSSGDRGVPLSARFCRSYERRSRVATSAAEAAAANAAAVEGEEAAAAKAAAGGARPLRFVSPAVRAAGSGSTGIAAQSKTAVVSTLPASHETLHKAHAVAAATDVEDCAGRNNDVHSSGKAAAVLSARPSKLPTTETASKKAAAAVARHVATAQAAAAAADGATKVATELAAGATAAEGTARGAVAPEAPEAGATATQEERASAGTAALVAGGAVAGMPSPGAGPVAGGGKKEPAAAETTRGEAAATPTAEGKVESELKAGTRLQRLHLPLFSAEIGSNWRSATASPHKAAGRATVAAAARATAATAVRDTATTAGPAAAAIAAGRTGGTATRTGAAGKTVLERQGGGGAAPARASTAARTVTGGAATRARAAAAAAERARREAALAVKEKNQGVLQQRRAPATARGDGRLYRKEQTLLVQEKGSRTARSRVPSDDLYVRFRSKVRSSSSHNSVRTTTNSSGMSSNSSNSNRNGSGSNSENSSSSSGTTCKSSDNSDTAAGSGERGVESTDGSVAGRARGLSSSHCCYSSNCSAPAPDPATEPEPGSKARTAVAAAAGARTAPTTIVNPSPHMPPSGEEEKEAALNVYWSPAAAPQAAAPVHVLHQPVRAAPTGGLHLEAAAAQGALEQRVNTTHVACLPVATCLSQRVPLPAPALRYCYTERQLLSPVENLGCSAAAYLSGVAPVAAAECAQPAPADCSWTKSAASAASQGPAGTAFPFAITVTTAAPPAAASAAPATARPLANLPLVSSSSSDAAATSAFLSEAARQPHLVPSSVSPGCVAYLHPAAADASGYPLGTHRLACTPPPLEGTTLLRAPSHSFNPAIVGVAEKGKEHLHSATSYSFNPTAAAESSPNAAAYPFIHCPGAAGYSAEPFFPYSLRTAAASAARRPRFLASPPASAIAVSAVPPAAGAATGAPCICPVALRMDGGTSIPSAATTTLCEGAAQAAPTGGPAVADAVAGKTTAADGREAVAAESATASERSENGAVTAAEGTAQVSACASSSFKSAAEAAAAAGAAAAADGPGGPLSACASRLPPTATFSGITNSSPNSDNSSSSTNSKSYVSSKSYSESVSSPSCRSSNSSCNNSRSSGVHVSGSSSSNSTRSRSSTNCNRSSSISSRSSSSNRDSAGNNGKKGPSLAVTAMKIDTGIKLHRRPLTARTALPVTQRYTHAAHAAAVVRRRGSAAAPSGTVGSFFDATAGVCVVQNVYQQVPQRLRQSQDQQTQRVSEQQQRVIQQHVQLLQRGLRGQHQEVQQQQRERAVLRRHQQSELSQQYPHSVSLHAQTPQGEQQQQQHGGLQQEQQQAQQRCTLQQQQLRQQRLWQQQHLALLQQHQQQQRLLQQQQSDAYSINSRGFKAKGPYEYGGTRYTPVVFRL